MKKILPIIMIVSIMVGLTACQKTEGKEEIVNTTLLQEYIADSNDMESEINELEVLNPDTFFITVGSERFIVEFEDNSSAQALKSLLEQNELTIEMSDYGGFEKVGLLDTTLPQNNSHISTEIGDVILYQGNQFVIYYGNNNYSLTRLGKIQDTTNLKEALGSSDVTVTLSLK